MHGTAHGPPHYHGHAHDAGESGDPRGASDGAFMLGAALNGAFVAAEALAGLVGHSMSLLADAGHNLGDVLGLLAAWLASRLGRSRPTRRFTYGLRGTSILVALGNSVGLLLITGAIAAEAISRLFAPGTPAGLTMMVVAAIGIVVNAGTALLFLQGRKRDLNTRAAFAHMAADAFVALGVVVAGAAILLTGWHLIDPLVSLIVSALIVASTWSTLRDSIGFALDAVPPGIDREAVEATLAALPGVTAVHDLHIWGMSTTETALTAHLVRPGAARDDALFAEACRILRQTYGIGHTTLQIEQGDAAFPCEIEAAGTI